MENESIFKVTALLYFKDALERQAYEECKDLLAFARQNGASQSEIQEVVTSFFKGDKTSGNEAENNRLIKFPPKADQPSAEKEG